jgi:hypothetical protein
MRRLSLLLVLFASFSAILLSQENQDLRKVVAFILLQHSDGKFYAQGTGFFAGVSRLDDTTKSFVVFVTAKHVLQRKNKTFYDDIYLRLNTIDGGSDIVRFPLITKEGPCFMIHSDPTSDVAVIAVPSGLTKHEIMYLSMSDMSDQQTLVREGIREGDDVMFCGMFINYLGKKRNYPIYRFGKVALLTDERVPFEGEQAFLYLLETTAFGGNSGSPVFFKISPNRNPSQLVIGAPTKYYLAGIMRGFYGAQIDTAYAKTAAGDTVLFQNAGIAAVTPSYQVLEVLNEIRSSTKGKR